MYADYSDYISYGRDLPEADFPRYAFKATRIMDLYTTGIDGVRKLATAFPVDEHDAQAVRVCFVELVDYLYTLDTLEAEAEAAQGYEKTADGLRGKVIASRSAGNESIYYGTASSTGSAQTARQRAVSDLQQREQMVTEIITRGLSGVRDANGVNLLYMGSYPHV